MEGQDEQHQQLLALQRSHIYNDGNDNDNDTKDDNHDNNTDNDNVDNFMLLTLSCVMWIVLDLLLVGDVLICVEVGRERNRTL